MTSLIDQETQKVVTKKYFSITKNIVNSVRKSFGVSEDEIKQNLEVLKEWIKKQPHLPQNLEDIFLEKMLLYNKFRIEKAKTKIDSFFSIRSLDPDIFQDLDKVRFSNADNVLYFMPKLTPENYRVLIGKLNSSNLENYSLDELIKNIVILIELVLQFDYNAGFYFILDMNGFTLSHAARVNLSILSKLIRLPLSLASMRIIAIDITSAPSYAVPLVNFAKTVVKSNIVQKINIYKDFSGLLNKIPKDCLPVELGGTCSNQKELLKNFDEMVKENQEHLKSIKNVKSVENQRIGNPAFKVHDFGPDGSFKKLNVD